MADMSNVTALITGAASGMGKASAQKFIANGAKVILTDLNETAGKQVQSSLGDKSLFLKQDVGNLADWQRVVADGEAKFGPINVLVNNAGMGIMKTIDDITAEEYDKVIKVNQYSVFYGMKTILPSMRRAGGGSIVNISSIGGLVGMPDSIAYGASKFAIRGMTKDAALELGKDHIRVNSVHPGIIETPLIQSIPKEQQDAGKKIVPLKRNGQPEEIANVIAFLASDESSFVTGAEFAADGGYTAQ
ncbi:glucose 1-dehydrogenase [Secundilactobacillus folii]|uniref:Glucose 1-dehydrogenase n=1 Tax=Secundilactobacillus folii TaxID=2678357 RepID=A0A7X3C2Y0_9LACO|nr:glucose 1-dehydrogenase [Secundilactobacillus folii]MTV82036.1 glucose 1-dehydrogenase [Secundilactobacillus folii]